MIATAMGSKRIVFHNGSRMTRDRPCLSMGGQISVRGGREQAGRARIDGIRIKSEYPCMERASSLKDYVRTYAEDRPGVYRWLGPNGRILYVGKSVRLRSRLLSYFRAGAGKAARGCGQVLSRRVGLLAQRVCRPVPRDAADSDLAARVQCGAQAQAAFCFHQGYPGAGAALGSGDPGAQRRRALLRARSGERTGSPAPSRSWPG